MEAAAFHPVHIKREMELPFYITSIGITPEEHRIYRPMGIDNYQILYSGKGCGTAQLYGVWVPVPEKSLLILPPDTAHLYKMQGNVWETYWLTFSGWGVERFFDVDATVIPVPEEIGFLDNFRRLLEYRNSQQWNLQSSALLYSILLDCKELIPKEAGTAYKLRKKLKNCFDYIQNHYMDVIELSQLAENSGMTREHLCRIFKQYTGMRPFEYITKIRLRKARELLVLHGEMSISEIAKKTGFQSSSYFSLVFRKCLGCTAEEYRKTNI